MKHRARLVEVLGRAEKGPMMDEKAFEGGLVVRTAEKLVEKYCIEYPKRAIIPSDDEMADRLYRAALEFASEVGMLCTDTSRRILWSEKEYEEGLRYCVSDAVLGEGNDAARVRARKIGDPEVPMIIGGPYGVEVPEALFVPLMLSYAQESVIDVIDNPTLEKVYGNSIKADSPWEVLAAWRELELSRQVIQRAGRLGLCVGGVEISPTALGEVSATSWGGFRPQDLHHAAGISEFKTNYESLSKVAHLTRVGAELYAFMACIFGGYFGGAAGVALGLCAAAIVLNQNYMPTIISASSFHPFLQCTTTREIMWAVSLSTQALSRNTHLLISSLVRPSSGPGTRWILYENAAFAVVATVSGQAFIQSSMSASGNHARHASGLEAKISGEVAHAVAGMERGEANEIVSRLVALYETELKERHVGRPFEQVYDVESVRPTVEWQGMYDEVKDELVRMGIRF